MSQKTDYQTYVTEQIDAAVTKALTEIQSFCPNVGCNKCKYKDDCVSTYRNRMKAMFLKGALYACDAKFSYYDFLQLHNKMIDNG